MQESSKLYRKRIALAFKSRYIKLMKNALVWGLFFVAGFAANATVAADSGVAEKKILAIGDSLTEGYGVAKKAAWPSLLEKKLSKEKIVAKVINAGVSGSTTASGIGVSAAVSEA